MVRRVVIVGTGGSAREILCIFEACNHTRQDYEVVGFLEKTDVMAPGTSVNGYPVLGDFPWLADHLDEVDVVCSPGSPALRLRLVQHLEDMGASFCNAIHPTVVISSRVQMGHNVVIAAGSILTDNVCLGDHVQVNMNCTIGHDTHLQDYATLAPGVHVSGAVTLSTGCYVGSGAALVQGITVGEWATVGLNSAVVRDVPGNTTVLGVPARPLQTRPAGWQIDQDYLAF